MSTRTLGMRIATGMSYGLAVLEVFGVLFGMLALGLVLLRSQPVYMAMTWAVVAVALFGAVGALEIVRRWLLP